MKVSGVTLRVLWDYFEGTLGSPWEYSGINFGVDCGHFEIILGSF